MVRRKFSDKLDRDGRLSLRTEAYTPTLEQAFKFLVQNEQNEFVADTGETIITIQEAMDKFQEINDKYRKLFEEKFASENFTRKEVAEYGERN